MPIEFSGEKSRRQQGKFGADKTSSVTGSIAGLNLEAFAIPESQRDAVAEGVEKVVLPVASSVANAKALDLVEQVIS